MSLQMKVMEKLNQERREQFRVPILEELRRKGFVHKTPHPTGAIYTITESGKEALQVKTANEAVEQYGKRKESAVPDQT